MKGLLASAAALAVVAFTQSANATIVATIDGDYDVTSYDTPSLTFHNTSGGTFTNAQMVLTPYQPGTLTYGLTPQTVSLPNIGVGDYTYTWATGYPGTVQGDLTSFDFDDSYGNTPSGYTNPNCVVGGGLCSLVGNFKVTFTAIISGGAFDGQAIFSVFSPTTNATNGFVGWEGLDPTGLSESIYDQHAPGITNATVGGTLANIELGTPPPDTPLPGTLPLFVSGVGALGLLARRRRRKLTTDAA